jgi:hypothetical protein
VLRVSLSYRSPCLDVQVAFSWTQLIYIYIYTQNIPGVGQLLRRQRNSVQCDNYSFYTSHFSTLMCFGRYRPSSDGTSTLLETTITVHALTFQIHIYTIYCRYIQLYTIYIYNMYNIYNCRLIIYTYCFMGSCNLRNQFSYMEVP